MKTKLGIRLEYKQSLAEDLVRIPGERVSPRVRLPDQWKAMHQGCLIDTVKPYPKIDPHAGNSKARRAWKSGIYFLASIPDSDLPAPRKELEFAVKLGNLGSLEARDLVENYGRY